MKAVFYSIFDSETKEVLDEGIISDNEQTIFPGQNFYEENGGDYNLPSECEAIKFFQHKGFKRKAEIKLVSFRITEDYIPKGWFKPIFLPD